MSECCSEPLASSAVVGVLTLNPALRYLMENMDWLEEELGSYEDDYLIFDCPGN